MTLCHLGSLGEPVTPRLVSGSVPSPDWVWKGTAERMCADRVRRHSEKPQKSEKSDKKKVTSFRTVMGHPRAHREKH